MFLGGPEEIVASAAVAPDSVEQVQKVTRIAITFKIPIYPISPGKNLGYGGSAPNLSGSVVLDLKRMNRVLEENDRNHYALVEPGVRSSLQDVPDTSKWAVLTTPRSWNWTHTR